MSGKLTPADFANVITLIQSLPTTFGLSGSQPCGYTLAQLWAGWHAFVPGNPLSQSDFNALVLRAARSGVLKTCCQDATDPPTCGPGIARFTLNSGMVLQNSSNAQYANVFTTPPGPPAVQCFGFKQDGASVAANAIYNTPDKTVQ
jgi:hypothetical protein